MRKSTVRYRHKAKTLMMLLVLAAMTSVAESVLPNKIWYRYFAQPNDTNLVYFGGWSKARAVTHPEYSVYLDVYYADGTTKWAVQAPFVGGTHDWEKASAVFYPEKPLKELRFYAIARKGTGEAEFRDFFFKREIKVEPSSVPMGESRVWTADSMTRVTPHTFPAGSVTARLQLELARREHESGQILISTAEDVEWLSGALVIGPLVDASGRSFCGRVTWQRVGYLRREQGYTAHPLGADVREQWLPDPLLPAAQFRVRKGSTQSLWITAYAADDALPGRYRGEIAVTERGVTKAKVPIEVVMRDFALPDTFGLPTAFSLMDGFLRSRYPDKFRKIKRQAWEVMLDHRLNADDISRTEPPAIEDLLYARKRGMNHFTILNIVPPIEPGSNAKWRCWSEPEAVFSESFYDEFTARLRPYVEQLRAHDLTRYASIYGFDERTQEYYEGMDKLWRRLKRDFPDVKVMTTAYMYRDYVRGNVTNQYLVSFDQQCPCTPAWRDKVTEIYRKAGKEVWWYTCCGPTSPYANMASYEHPTIEGRLLLGFMSHHYGADGFLYWHVNFWDEGSQPNLKAEDTFFPQWHTANRLNCPGDGIFLYPGEDEVYPSIRLAQLRDGVEDWEWLDLACKRVGRERVKAISSSLVRSLTDYTRNPVDLRVARHALGELIETK